MRRTALLVTLAALVGALVAVPIAVYASHQFTDVPNTNPFHADITWLADAGVTKGCSTTAYCPKDNVTREQMAAFMHRLSGNDGGVAPSVNADQLDGYSVQHLAPRAVHGATIDVPDLGTGIFEYRLFASQQLVAPAPGIILLSGGVEAFAFGSFADTRHKCELEVDGMSVLGSGRTSNVDNDGPDNHEEDCTTSGAVTVGAGTYSISLHLSQLRPDLGLKDASVWAMWVPFDGNGNTP